ncbi:glycosyltransferase family 4 protein [Actinomycetaceae bacterium L2_0104]
MRILLVSDCFAPRLGGIESQVHDLALVLMGRGHEVIVVTATPNKKHSKPAWDRVDGIPVLRLTTRLVGDVPWNPFAGRRLRALFTTADVIHIHTGLISLFAQHAIVVAASMRVPTCVTWHCMLGPWWPLFHVVRFAQWAAKRGVTMNAVSSQLVPAVQRIVGDRTKVGVLHNGMDPRDWTEVAARRLARGQATGHSGASDGRGPVRIVASRRLASRKRNDVLVRLAVAAQEKAGIPVELTIFGDGPEFAELEALIEHLDAPWIRLAGRVDRDTLRSAYEDADIYFSTALMESFGIATLEGRTAGLPIVAPDNTGVVDFCENGVDGLLGDGDDDLCDCLARMIADEELRERIARHNAAQLPPQNWDSIAEDTIAEYERARAAQQNR